MKKILLSAALIIGMTLNTALAAHWIPLIEGTERVPGVQFDVASMQRSETTLYFWEKVEQADNDYELRFAKVGLSDFEFADALMAKKKPGEAMVHLHPTDWEKYGSNGHPVRLAWLDRVLVKADEAVAIGSDIDLVTVEVPGDF